jgi:hypothetical protein
MAFNISYSAGGTLDELGTVRFIEGVHGFASFLQPYNIMECIEVPAVDGEYQVLVQMPDSPVELLGFTVSCTGYGELDCYDLWINDNKVFHHWYMQEVKEGLFIGSSTYVYRTKPNSVIKVVFNNASGRRKKLYVGVRALVPSAEQLEALPPEDQEQQDTD